MTATDYWPLPGLRLRVADLELRLPNSADLAALAGLAAAGIHDPAIMPFVVPWTDGEAAERALRTMRHHWSCLGSWDPAHWDLNLVAVRGETVVATQGIGARDFATLREVSTGSWVGRQFQGQGIGTAMRAAVLSLAFDGLGAEYATSGAFPDNAASLAVSRKLGYRSDGVVRFVARGKPVDSVRLRIDRATWLAHRKIEVDITGLAPCLPFFGLD
jgi:RimJ/RimL family protein N-acetyltransferase